MIDIKKNKLNNYLKEMLLYFIFSILIYAQVFIHDILECDEFGIIYRDNYLWDISLGRFAGGLYDIITSFLGFSVQSTYYSIVMFSLIVPIGLIIIFNILNINGLIFRSILAFICLSFQSFMTINIFRCVIIRWALSFTLPCIASLIVINLLKNNNILELKNVVILLLSCFLLVLSIGFTQAALSVFSVILLLDLVNNSIDGKKFKSIFLKAIFYFIFILISSIIYILLMNLIQKIFGLSFPRSYPDINTIVTGIFKCYARYIWLIATTGNFQKILYIILYIIILFEYFVLFMQAKTNRVCFSLFSLLIPIAIGLSGFMQKDGAPIRAWFALIFVFIIPVYFYQKIEDNKYKIRFKNINNILIIVLLGHSICNFYNTQSYYQNRFSLNEASKAFAIELASSIKDTEGYSVDKKVCIIGNSAKLNLDGYTTYPGKSNLLAVSWSFIPGLKKYGAIDFELVDSKKREELLNKIEVKDMPVYPNHGSIKIIDDVIVIKVSN